MTTDTVVERIRKALFNNIHDAEGSLRDALEDLAISGGGSGEHIMRRIRYHIFHTSVDTEANLRAALADLQIAGNRSQRRIIQRIRQALFLTRIDGTDEENDLRLALSDLLGVGGNGNGNGNGNGDGEEWITDAEVAWVNSDGSTAWIT